MPPLKRSDRVGVDLEIRRHPLPFGLWPLRPSTGGFALQSRLFTNDPWPIMRRAIVARCKEEIAESATAFLEQSEDYYRAASIAGVAAAKPVLLYYCFLNLAKAFVLLRGVRASMDNARHGLSEESKGIDIANASVKASPSGTAKSHVFDELLKALGRPGLASAVSYSMSDLFPQIVPGHRLWAAAARGGERFTAIEEGRFLEEQGSRTVWCNLYVRKSELLRIGLTHKRFLDTSTISEDWEEVESDSESLLCFQQKTTTKYHESYVDRGAYKITEQLRNCLWEVVTSNSPYRKYYVYRCTAAANRFTLPQLASAYAIMFYLGSITRYRPYAFKQILEGEYGPFIESFLTDQPRQFVYLMATNFLSREVAKANLV